MLPIEPMKNSFRSQKVNSIFSHTYYRNEAFPLTPTPFRPALYQIELEEL